MKKEEIKRLKYLFWSATELSIVALVVAIICFWSMLLKLGFIFTLLSSVMLLLSYLFEYASLKKVYREDFKSLTVPSLVKRRNSVNPNNPREKSAWIMKFTFPICLSLVSIFALVVCNLL